LSIDFSSLFLTIGIIFGILTFTWRITPFLSLGKGILCVSVDKIWRGRMKKLFVLGLIAVFIAFNAQAVEYYDDGQEHEISTPVTDDISIWDGSIVQGDHLGGPTIVNLVSGGSVGVVEVYQTSSFNVFTGGEVFGSVHSYNESNFTIYSS
jgi:hypothetical protein